jgi:ATP-dependent DNA ligase
LRGCIAELYAFDLLELDGEDWRPRPLAQRKVALAKLFAKAPAGISFSWGMVPPSAHMNRAETVRPEHAAP